MSDVVVYKDEAGKLRGLGEKGDRAWQRFRSYLESMAVGETISFAWFKPRSPKFHRLFFAFLGELMDRQEQFDDINALRAWLTVGAGYATFVPGPTGRMVALPKSIAWHRMDDNEFRELVLAVWDFLRTEHAQRFLWPHLDDGKAVEQVETLLLGYQP